MQCESLLEPQRQMASRCGQDNAQTRLGLWPVPTVPQIRNILDQIAAVDLCGIFNWVDQALQRGGDRKPYPCLGDPWRVALEGPQDDRSTQIHCPHCARRTHKNGPVTYAHPAIWPVMVAPRQADVITLAPVFIQPQEGAQQQDCAVNAANRWMTPQAPDLRDQAVTRLGDDRYRRQPMCEPIRSAEMNVIVTGWPESHPPLDDGLTDREGRGEMATLEPKPWHKRTKAVYRYRDVTPLPLRDALPELLVNGDELTLNRESAGPVWSPNALITDHHLDAQTGPPIIAAGRWRWKTANENHPGRKTKGDHLEHNFGHGPNHRSAVLLTLTLWAFLVHPVLHLVDPADHQIRQQRGTRKGFFQDILTLTKDLWFDSWPALIDFMWSDASSSRATNSS